MGQGSDLRLRVRRFPRQVSHAVSKPSFSAPAPQLRGPVSMLQAAHTGYGPGVPAVPSIPSPPLSTQLSGASTAQLCIPEEASFPTQAMAWPGAGAPPELGVGSPDYREACLCRNQPVPREGESSGTWGLEGSLRTQGSGRAL